jgi:glycosyltransferase involved in cell wall biosynthesis
VLVSILIPCHDEAEALPRLFAELDRLPALFRPDHFPEILFVDDGSEDHSLELLYDYADRSAMPVRVLGLDTCGGLGQVLREGAPLVAGDVVVTYDADRPYPLDDAPRLVALIDEGNDVVTASPWHPSGEASGAAPWRFWLSRTASRLYRLRLGRRARNLHTFTCGYRAYRTETLRSALPRRSGFVATTEILLNALRQGARAAELPSTLRARTEGTSKMRTLRVALTHLPLLLRG